MADGGERHIPMKLTNTNLRSLPKEVLRPNYDRAALTPGIVHIGLGNFHRAHQAWYLHRLMQQGKALDWAIIGAGVRLADAVQRDKLASQDYLTTLIELDPTGRSAEVTGAMIDFVAVEADNASLIQTMARPEIRIVSMTVTEGGYFQDSATGAFDPDHPDIAHDAQHPDTPRTAFGAMIAALKLRRAEGCGPFAGLSCDNLQGNGNILRQTVVSLARLSDPDLADWIELNVSFPNSMVDCIVPASGAHEVELAQSFGIIDATPVTHENFRQWVIEDDFCAGRPPWEDVGATMSNQVHAFEAMKIRILNGGHQIIAVPADVLSIETISEAAADPQINAFLQKVISDEVAPHVAAVPNCSAAQYLELITDRFSNPEIVDTTRRVAFDGSSRQPGFLAPSIRDGLAKGTSVEGLALASAIWARYCVGGREDGSVIEDNDPNWDDLKRRAHDAQNDPDAWLSMTNIYGEIASEPAFRDAFRCWLPMIHRDGVRAAIATYLAG